MGGGGGGPGFVPVDRTRDVTAENTLFGSGERFQDFFNEGVEQFDFASQINAALDTAIAELGVATPAATPNIRTGLMLLYMALRNKRDTTASMDEIHNNAGAVIADAAVSDDTVTFSKAKYVAP